MVMRILQLLHILKQTFGQVETDKEPSFWLARAWKIKHGHGQKARVRKVAKRVLCYVLLWSSEENRAGRRALPRAYFLLGHLVKEKRYSKKITLRLPKERTFPLVSHLIKCGSLKK